MKKDMILDDGLELCTCVKNLMMSSTVRDHRAESGFVETSECVEMTKSKNRNRE